MTVPIELVTALFIAMVGLQGWILVEIIALKVRLNGYEETKSRVDAHEQRIIHIEARCGIEGHDIL